MSVRLAFETQASICTAAGAPFTGRLCRLIGERLTADNPIGARVLGWQGNPSHEADALPLRLMGGLHALARAGHCPEWTAVYPPAKAPDDDALWSLLQRVLQDRHPWLLPWLQGPPQTNEVGRSAVLMSGLLVLAERYGLPFSLFELGASAGLNSLLDYYGYNLGGLQVGDPESRVQLAPRWNGPPPPEAEVRVISRAGVDRRPLDPADLATHLLLKAYVWADQKDRMERLSAALNIADSLRIKLIKGDAADGLAPGENPPVQRHPDLDWTNPAYRLSQVMRMHSDDAPTDLQLFQDDAASWLETSLSTRPEPGVCRVVMHTIAYQYFPREAQARIRRHLMRVGANATEQSPLAWLSFEAEEGGGAGRRPVLQLTMWPSGETLRLADAQAHGAEINWTY